MAGTAPIPVPPLNIPPSSSTVKVSVIDSSSRVGRIPPKMFLKPEVSGHKYINGPAYSFLIEHEGTGKKVLFDLGIPKDWQTALSPTHLDRLKSLGDWYVDVPTDVSSILTAHSVPLSAITSIIYSHHHWDHIGDPSLFPKSTSLTVGPGFKKAFMPGYPADEAGEVPSRAWEDREFIEVSFDKGLKLGRFNAIDYFGDGSFYLLDAPGHTIGHISALARTTGGEGSTFIHMIGDACHHGGEYRPSQHLPLPSSVVPNPYTSLAQLAALARSAWPGCPGAAFVDVHPEKSATKAFYSLDDTIPTTHDAALAEETVGKLQEFDAREDVFTIMAHDQALFPIIDLYPKSANEWKAKGWRERGLWRFLRDFTTSEGQGEEGRGFDRED